MGALCLVINGNTRQACKGPQSIATLHERTPNSPQIWLMAAQFEIRQHRLDAARKILGMALGLCPKDKIFNSYITLELQLGQFERCRQLYSKYLEWRPENCRAWCKWVELEQSLGEVERCRAMYELAIQMPVLDMPEVLWKVRTASSSPALVIPQVLVCKMVLTLSGFMAHLSDQLGETVLEDQARQQIEPWSKVVSSGWTLSDVKQG